MKRVACLLLCGLTLPWAPRPARSDEPSRTVATTSAADSKKELFTGRVVMAAEALDRKGLKTSSEMNGQVVLETEDGTLIPILADWRGRAFFQDERLRNRRVELVGSRRPGVPYLQILMVFTFNEQGEREYTDYWCDVCAIPMYEVKPCECCQGEIRLRFQPQKLPSYLDATSRAK